MRTIQMLKTSLAAFVMAVGVAACGGEDTSNNPGGGGTTTTETCSHSYECINGACACASGPRKDSSCCDPDTCSGGNACNSFCNVCS